MMEPTSDNGSPEDDTTNLVPAHVIETKRKERAERIKLATSTIIGQAISGEAAAP
jgi:hypothetical protein